MITVGEVGFRLATAAPITVPFIAGVVSSVPFAFVLAGGAYRLPETDIAPDQYDRIAVGALTGMVLFLSFFIIIAIYFFNQPLDQAGLLRWAISVGAGGGFLVGFQNTRRVEQAVQAERARVQAEEAQNRQELLEYLNALLRHEVLNSTNIISGQAALLEPQLDGDADAAARLEVIQNQTDDLNRIIDDVQLLLQAAEYESTLEPVDIVPTIQDELDRLATRHQDAQIDYDLPRSAMVPADDLVRRLFSNLFANAVQHNDEPAPVVTVTGTLDTDTVTIDIADNGPGIPTELRDDLFDPSVSLEDDQSRLGTVIVGRLVNRYNGDICVATTGSDGTTIRVSLPLATKTSASTNDRKTT